MRKNSIKNIRINEEVLKRTFQYYPRGNQRPADQSDDQRGCGGSSTGLKDL